MAYLRVSVSLASWLVCTKSFWCRLILQFLTDCSELFRQCLLFALSSLIL